MLTVDDRLRAAAVEVQAFTTELPVPDLEPAVRPAPTRVPAPTIRRGLVVSVTTAFVLLVAIGGIALWTFTGEEEPVATTVPPTTTTTPTTTAAPDLVSLPDAWQRVETSATASQFGLFDITQTPSGLVAVGFDPGDQDSRQNGVVLASTDGVSWNRLAGDDPAMNQGTVALYGVTAGGPGLVAVGLGCDDVEELCMAHPMAWTSTDGVAWSRSSPDPNVFGTWGGMSGVISSEHGIVAVGNSFVESDPQSLLVRPTVWLSADGVEWERAWSGDEFDGAGAALGTGFSSITSNPDGLLVGVGMATNSQGGFVAAVWTSTDGRTWERIDPDSPAFASHTDSDVAMHDVAWGPGGLVAVGTDGGTNVAIWHSPDGLTWTRADTADQPFEHIGTLGSVDALGTGWVAVGPHRFAEMTGDTVMLWTSTDGLTWDRALRLDPGYGMAVVTTDSGIAVAGGLAGPESFHAAIWAGPAFDPATPPPDPGAGASPDEPLFVPPGIDDFEEGLPCDAIAEMRFSYAEAVAYWLRFEYTESYDLDIDGPPCAEAFDAGAVSELFGEPVALSVRILQEHSTGTFEATGPAVDGGLICATGTIEHTDDPEFAGPVLRRWENTLTCDDGSGALQLGVDEYIVADGAMYGVWGIVSGTGAYEGLRGGGATDSVLGSFDDSIGRLWPGSDEG